MAVEHQGEQHRDGILQDLQFLEADLAIWALVVAVLCRSEDCYEGDERAEKGDVLICPSVQREMNDEGKKSS